MRRHLAVQAVALVAVGAGAYVIGGGLADNGSRADLIVTQDVPDDVKAELDVTWDRFLDRFGSRQTCFTDVSVTLVRDVEGGDARYVNEGARIEIEIPTTPARFSESFAHELAHHIERTCREFAGLQAVLHPRLGGPQRAWSNDDVWEESPSEVWAEAVVQVVNGERILHADEMPIDEGVIELVEAWGRG